MKNFTYWIASLCVLSPQLWSATITVSNTNDSGTGSLRAAMSSPSNGDVITFSSALPAGSTIALTSGDLPVISVPLRIDGSAVANLTISGSNANRIFFVDAPGVTIQNLILSSGKAIGGAGGPGTNVPGGNNNDGGSGGGGGLGAGGAVFAGSLASNLTLTNITFSNNTSVGGDGGGSGPFVSGGGGGGGGLQGDGGQNGSGGELTGLTTGGGGGGGGGYPYPISSSFVNPVYGSSGLDANATTPTGGTGGAGAGNIAGGAGGPDTSGPGGPGSAVTNSGQGGGGGGGGTGTTSAAVGGAGGSGIGAGPFSYGGGGGGGGGAYDINASGGVGGAGGAGSFGAGGGGGGSSAAGGGIGGAGGFGAGGGGGGGGSTTAAGTSGYGAGTARGGNLSSTGNGYGGGGAAFGGAIFVRDGASITLGGTLSFSNIAPVAGADGNGATTATASSTDLFINSGADIAFNLSSPLTISTVIASDNLNPAGSFTVSGTSILTLTAANSYLANNIISSGTLAIGSDASLGASSNIVTLGGGTLKTATTSATITTARPINITALSTIDVNGGSFTASGVISGNALQIVSSSSSSGTFTPSNNSNTFSGLTMSSGSVLISNAGQIGAGTLTFNGGTLQTSTTLSLANSIATSTGTTSSLQVDGNTTLTLSSAISGAGRINFINTTASTTGVLQLELSSPSFAGTLGLGGSSGSVTLLAGASITLPNNFVFGSSSTINVGANTLTLSGTLSGSAVNITDGGSSGTLALASASNSANATLNVNSGRLQVNNSNVGTLNMASATALQFGVTGLNLSRPIAGSGTYTIDTQAFSETISAAISGSGFTKIGSGTLILTNANTYSGLTTVSAGTLQINTDSNLGVAPSVSLAAGTTLLIGANLTSNATIALAGNATINAGAFALTLNNPITGGNALTSTGTGTLTLAAGNSLSATTVLSGTLAIQDGSTGNLTLASGVNLNVLSSTTFASTITLGGSNIINIANNTFNISGSISGTGPLIKNGRGVLILGGTNTYSGGTQSNQGTLQISSDTNLGTGTVSLSSSTLQAGSSFTLNHAVALTGSNFIDTNGFNLTEQAVISGTGTLNKIGSGTLTFTAVNTYSGQTIIQTGTLALSGSGQLPATGVSISSGAILDISAASSPQTIRSLSGSGDVNLGTQQLTLGSSTESTTFAGTFTGTGNLVKDGTATLSLSQSSPGYSGAVTITRGTLNLLNISLPASINIQLNGVLSGTGSVGSVTNAGTISPGNSIGTINILGNYVQTGTGTLVSEVSASSADLLEVTGTASLNGALNVVVYPGTYLIGNTATLVNAAGGVSGAWTSNNLASLDVAFGVQYTATQAQLIVLENNIFFGRDIEGFNPNAVAQYFTDVVPSSDSALSDILLQLGELSSSDLTHALDTMHPAQMGAIRLIRESQSAMLSDLLAYRVEELCCQRLETAPKCAPTALWIEPYDQFLRIDSIDEQKGFNANTVGFAIGADHCFSSGIALGLASGYSYTDLNWMKSAGSGTLHSVFAGIYSDWLEGPFSLNTSIIGAKDFFDVTRHIFFPGFSAKAKSDHDAWEYDVHLGTGYDYPIYTWTSTSPVVYMRPFVDFDYFNIYEGSFKESGAGVLDLDVQNKHSQFLRSQLGIQLSRSMMFSKGCWSPSLYLSWINIHTFSNRNYVSSYTGFDQTFTVHSYQRNWNLFSPGFDFSVNFNSGLILVMKYEAQFNGSYMIQQGNVRFEWSF